ncbi:nucleoporin GLE1-like [Elysia marginata]|uniref:mRNA export factor GLE1 n=1 Tax=Elysia marginata TaxID=1093978 RepID=A0AAV4HHS2_9GAST|nr:nucleoporin GLE1-like [Elysia marginata]
MSGPVCEALRTTPKGRLVYMKEIDCMKLKDELDQVSPTPLSRYHTEKESSKLNLSFSLYSDNSNLSNNGDYQVKDGVVNVENHSKSDETLSSPKKLVDRSNSEHSSPLIVTPPSKHSQDQFSKSPVLDAVSPSQIDSLEALEAILHAEEMYESRVQRSRFERCKKHEEHNRNLTNFMMNQRLNVQRKIEHLKEKRQNSIERKQQAAKAEADRKLQSLRENNERHKEKMDTKQKEIEQKRLHLEREQKKREEECQHKYKQLKSLVNQVQENNAKFTKLYESFEHKQSFPELVGKFKAEMDKACAHLPLKLQQAFQTGNLSDELFSEFQNSVDQTQKAVIFINKQIVEISSQLKEVAEKKKQEEVKQAEDQKKVKNAKKQEAAAAIAQECGVQALSHALKERRAKHDLLAQVEASIKGFVTNSNPQVKQYRFDLQRAVNTPINAISGGDLHHLRDKLHRLLSLLRGQEVKISGRSIRADKLPEALLFCQNLIAKMLVRKGEEQVSSLHESAFPIAAVLLGLWCEFPIVGDLFMAHLQSMCPYVLPYYHFRQEGETVADYHRSLGYKVEEDGTVEEQDKFLRRMSGLMRLYCACLITSPPPPTPGGATRPPQGHTQFPHPHGLENGWMWLARVMDQDPHPDITAGLTYDVLVSCGTQLMRQYSIQFVKLVYLLYKQYLPKLKSVAVTNATLARLEIFLEAALKSGRIPEPEGILPAHFWFH